MRETNRSFDSCNSFPAVDMKYIQESKFSFLSRVEFLRSKRYIFPLMYPGSSLHPAAGTFRLTDGPLR